jgi:hypothetical protein
LRQFLGARFRDGFSFGDLLLAGSDILGAFVELLLTLGEPMPRAFPFGFEIGFLNRQLTLAAIERRLFALQAIGKLGGVFAKQLQGMLDDIASVAGM